MLLHHILAWTAFLGLVLVMLAIDLFVLHRKPHVIRLKEAFIGTLIPVISASLFAVAVFFAYQHRFMDLGAANKDYPEGINGAQATLMFVTGYLMELSLSADNVFLFVVLMAFFKVPPQLQHRVLFWGVMGALIMRAIMILAGTALLSQFHWIIYLFGAFLLFTGVKMFFSSDEPKDPANNFTVRLVRKMFPFHEGYDGPRFFTRINGKRLATTLFLVLICIEFTDLVFALDSIPAVFGITLDPYLVFTSNVFAILGLRSMYFLLAGVIDRFYLLKYGLALVLGFVGVKMVLPLGAEVINHYTGSKFTGKIDQFIALGVIVLCLAGSIIASLLFPSAKHHQNPLVQGKAVRPARKESPLHPHSPGSDGPT
jgi:tellurite resistance protein TerC